jgi:hypothetical protein
MSADINNYTVRNRCSYVSAGVTGEPHSNLNSSEKEHAWYTSADLRPIAEAAEVLLAELVGLSQSGPVLRIAHRFQRPGTDCQEGEEIWMISVIHRGRETVFPLSLALRQVVNYLAETRHIPQSATQIAAGMRRSAFYVKHGLNSGIPSKRKISRSAIKEYVKRIRKAFDFGFRETGLRLDSKQVLVSKCTMGNEIHYQLRARIQWVHLGSDGARHSLKGER